MTFVLAIQWHLINQFTVYLLFFFNILGLLLFYLYLFNLNIILNLFLFKQKEATIFCFLFDKELFIFP